MCCLIGQCLELNDRYKIASANTQETSLGLFFINKTCLEVVFHFWGVFDHVGNQMKAIYSLQRNTYMHIFCR